MTVKPRKTAPDGFEDAVAASRAAEEQERAEAAAKPHDTRTRILAEAAALGPGWYGRFLWLDARCAAVGMHAASPWWRGALRGFYESGARWFVVFVGRGGAKSMTLERLASADAYLTERVVPPGETWDFPFVSVGPEDANRRIKGIHKTFSLALGLDVGEKPVMSPRAHIETTDLHGNLIALRSVAGTVGNLSGPNTIGLIIDEAAKLLDRSTNANPLSEILASAIATFRARPDIRAIVCSSAWTRSGAHFALVEQGDTETNYVARIGERFLDAALEGLEAVALWEEIGDMAKLRVPDPEAAKVIRAHAKTLTARSPAVPTWVANEMYGATPALAAIATRREVQALPETMLDGLPRHRVWLREIASVPLDVDGGPDMEEQCRLAAEITRRLAERFGGRRPQSTQGQVMKVPGARPGDARYAGPVLARGQRVDWRRKKVL